MKHRLKQYIKRIDYLACLYRFLLFQKHKYYFNKDPHKAANIDFKKIFNRNIDWNNPKNLIEKINWMQFNTDTSLWTKCADKFLVRDYVEKHGCGSLLPKLYGHFYSVDDIDFEALPKEYVLKSNNACETVLLVNNKSQLDIKKTKKVLKKWLSYEFGIFGAQLHYLKITPCIIAEEYLHDANQNLKSLIDYKFTCFFGIPESILVVSERDIKDHSYVLNLYDTNWNSISHNLCMHKNNKTIEKPKSFDKMIDACMRLGKNMPYVRIDFYEIDGRPYFGELTFTTGFGYFTDEYYDYLGSKIDINKFLI